MEYLRHIGYMKPLKILSFSSLFPNSLHPWHGIFLENRLASMAEIENVEIRVVAPVPYFPWSGGVFGKYSLFARVPSSGIRRGLRVTYPRYFSIPKFGMNIAPWLLASGLVAHLKSIKQSGFDFDVIDSYYLYPDGVAAAALGAIFKKPVILTAFGSDVSLLPQYLLPRKSILWAARRSRQITSVCRALKDGLTAIGVLPDHIHVIPHGVDLERFRPPADRQKLRARLGLARPTLLSVGHLIDRKGHDLAIRAMPLLPQHTLVIVGDGPAEASLKHLVRQLRLEDRVRFTGGMPQKELSAWLGAADVLVNCSDREGIANVLLEAMACGTPAAATPVWGSPEVISVPEAGVLLRDRSSPALAEAVLRLQARPPDRAMTRRHAERFEWADTAREHMQAIRRAVGSGGHQFRGLPVGRSPLSSDPRGGQA